MSEVIGREAPDSLDPRPHRAIAGNWTDDDAQVIDETFEPAYNGPVSSESTEYEKEEIPPITRILSRSISVGDIGGGQVADPVQVFPADPRRKEIMVQCSAPVVIGSDKTDVYNGAAINANNYWVSTQHTGALWVYSTGAATTVVVQVVTV